MPGSAPGCRRLRRRRRSRRDGGVRRRRSVLPGGPLGTGCVRIGDVPGRALAAQRRSSRCIGGLPEPLDRERRARCSSSISRRRGWRVARARTRSWSGARTSSRTVSASGSTSCRATSTSARCSTPSRRSCARRPVLVSYNGKSFDVPVLETRYQFNRLAPPFEGMAHVDMLHVARRFWRAAPAGAGSMARHRQLPPERARADPRSACGASATCRGYEIPSRYFDFMRTGNAVAAAAGPRAQPARPVVARDADRTRASTCCGCAPEGCTSARESLAAGRLLDRAGRGELAMRCFEDAVERARHERGADAGLVGPRRSTRWRCACADRAATTTRPSALAGDGGGAAIVTSRAARRARSARHSLRAPRARSRRGAPVRRSCRWPNVWGRREWRPAATGWRGSIGSWR